MNGSAASQPLLGCRGWIDLEDVRSLIRLAGEARELWRDGAPAVKPALVKLAALADADGAFELTFRRSSEGALEMESFSCFVGASDPAASRVHDCVVRRVADMARAAPRIVTLLHSGGRRGRNAREARCACNALISLRGAGEDGLVRVLVLHRGTSKPTFESREIDLVHLFVTECQWLYDAPPSRAPVTAHNRPLPCSGMSPRQQQTLDLLLTGVCEKEIAVALDVSRNTAHEYVLAVYRRVGVRSRAELMARAIARE
jgi:DNA-binding CsgD family transcriptional regulator